MENLANALDMLKEESKKMNLVDSLAELAKKDSEKIFDMVKMDVINSLIESYPNLDMEKASSEKDKENVIKNIENIKKGLTENISNYIKNLKKEDKDIEFFKLIASRNLLENFLLMKKNKVSTYGEGLYNSYVTSINRFIYEIVMNKKTELSSNKAYNAVTMIYKLMNIQTSVEKLKLEDLVYF